MATTSAKIHPAIGIAWVGNRPDEFFIGPELPLDRTVPPGGYKDNQCRVKRQVPDSGSSPTKTFSNKPEKEILA